MAAEVVMPQMGYDMTQGTIVRWLKKEGDAVSKGEAIAEIETDKAVVQLEAFAGGVLGKILAAEGQALPVGQTIAVIVQPGEAMPAIAQKAAPSAREPAHTTEKAPAPPAEAPTTADRIKASPVARRVAQEHGVDLAQVKGTGPGGRIERDDVLTFQEQQKKAPTPPAKAAPSAEIKGPGVVPLTAMRQTVARRMAQSKREAPHFYVSVEVDMTEAMRLRQQLNESLGGEVRITVNDMIVRAAAKALQKFPQFNSHYTEAGIQAVADINIGIAIALEGGLIAPAILDCAHKSLVDIARASKDLAERAKSGVLRPEEYTGPTFSISNLGMFDVENFIAIIPPGQAAVLAVGSVRPQPVAKDSQIVVAQMMKTTLSSDHRVVDGALAAQFMAEVKQLLQNPLRLLV